MARRRKNVGRAGFSKLNDEFVAVRRRGLSNLDRSSRGPLKQLETLDRLSRSYQSASGLPRQQRIELLVRAATPLIGEERHRERVTLLFGLTGGGFASPTSLRRDASELLNEQTLSESARVVRDRRAFQSLESAIHDLLKSQTPTTADETSGKVDALIDHLSRLRLSAATGVFQVDPRDDAFVNREDELQRLDDLTRGSTSRLIVVTGMGGIGKTAVANEFAHTTREKFPDGVVSVDLSSGQKAEDILYAIAQAFDRGRELLQLRSWQQRASFVAALLDGKRTLVLLHEVENPSRWASLRAALRTTHMVVTSRHKSLGYGQSPWVIDLQPLSDTRSFEVLAGSIGLGRLSEDLTAAQDIVDSAGGLPLALRIIGARISKSPDPLSAFAARLRSRRIREELQLRSSPPSVTKETSVWVSFAVSHEDLSEDLSRLLTAVATFGKTEFSTPAAAAVDASAEANAAYQLNDLLDLSLIERSSLGRWRLHPLVHDYVVDVAPPTNEQFGQLVQYAVGLAEEASSHARTPAQGIWFNRLDSELGVVQAALSRARSEGDNLAEARILSSLLWYWIFRGRQEEAYPRLEALATASLPSEVMCAVLRAACYLAGDQSSFHRAMDHAVSWLHVAEGIKDEREIAAAHDRISSQAWCLGAYNSALEHAEISLRKWRELQDPRGVATAVNLRGLVRGYLHDYEGAQRDFLAAMSRWHRAGDDWGEATALNNLGEVERCRNLIRSARANYERSLEMRVHMRDAWSVANSLNNLAELERAVGSVANADRYFQQSFELALPMRNLVSLATSIAGRATLRMVSPKKAALLIGASERLLHDSGSRLGPANFHDYAGLRQRMVDFLGVSEFQKFFDRGWALSDDEVGVAMATLDPISPPQAPRTA